MLENIIGMDLIGSTQNVNAVVYLLILMISVSSVITELLYLFEYCCGQFWGNISSVCFQLFAASLELREERFDEVTNLLIFPRIFEQLQMHTFKVIWNHDANAQSGDFVQWGLLRLPTKSYLLALLAFCGVTHYVYIPRDLKSVEIVGPADAIAILVDLSKVAATTRLTETQLDSLRHAFGMGDAWTKADKVFVLVERCLVRCMLSACCMGLAFMLIPGSAWNVDVVGVVLSVVYVCWYKVFRAR